MNLVVMVVMMAGMMFLMHRSDPKGHGKPKDDPETIQQSPAPTPPPPPASPREGEKPEPEKP